MTAQIEAVPAAAAPASTATLVWQGLTRSPSGFAGACISLSVLVFAFVVPLFVDTANPSDGTLVWAPPSADHPLGTNHQGKDTLLKVIAGGHEPIMVGLLAAVIAVAVAAVVGAFAGYLRKSVDTVLLTVTDIVLTIPGIVLMLVIAAMFRDLDAFTVGIIIGLTTWPVLMRSIRAQVMSLREREFVEAAKLQNLGTIRIVFREILPNMAGYIFVNFILAINNAIYALVGMYLLGLLPSQNDNWGLMIQESWSTSAYRLPEALPYIGVPLLLIILFQIGLVTMTRSLEQALNPRLRER